jgi:hypothetical protein
MTNAATRIAENAPDCHVTLTAGAIDAHREALMHIADAWLWAENLSDLRADLGEAMDERTLAARRELVHKMQLSYHENLTRLMVMAQGYDGGLRFFRDGEACMFWRHAKSGYCGGLILHRNVNYSKAGEPIVVGEWSVHT